MQTRRAEGSQFGLMCVLGGVQGATQRRRMLITNPIKEKRRKGQRYCHALKASKGRKVRQTGGVRIWEGWARTINK